jgi:hypothetical protein
MPNPFSFQFGPWVPDGADIAVTVQSPWSAQTLPVADCLNVYYANGTYLSTPTSSPLAGTPTLPSASVYGAFTALDTSGNPQVYAGGGTDLYHWTGSAWTNVSKSAGAYTSTAHWSFAEFGGCICAANGVQILQDMTLGGSAFADVANAPIGSVLGVINQFLIVGDITTGNFPYRLMWSGIADPTNWPTPLTNAAIAAQSGQQDLTQDFGRVFGIAGYEQYGIVLQQHGLTRVAYVGGDVVFSFSPYEYKRGVVGRNAWVKVGGMVYFLADDGFMVTDGSSVQPIGRSEDGQQGIEKWLRSNLNWAQVSQTSAAWDAVKKCVMFAVCTGGNTTPDTLLIYNPTAQRWTKTTQTANLLWTDSDGVTHQCSLFDTNAKYAQLTGAGASGYVETYDVAFTDGNKRLTTRLKIHGATSSGVTARVSTRDNPNDALTLSADNALETYARDVPFVAQSTFYNRWRVTDSAITALYGATAQLESGGTS